MATGVPPLEELTALPRLIAGFREGPREKEFGEDMGKRELERGGRRYALSLSRKLKFLAMYLISVSRDILDVACIQVYACDASV